jgi:hypothetical protein
MHEIRPRCSHPYAGQSCVAMRPQSAGTACGPTVRGRGEAAPDALSPTTILLSWAVQLEMQRALDNIGFCHFRAPSGVAIPRSCAWRCRGIDGAPQYCCRPHFRLVGRICRVLRFGIFGRAKFQLLDRPCPRVFVVAIPDTSTADQRVSPWLTDRTSCSTGRGEGARIQ